jgi:GntR family transcriptional regulator/MocR family aminotransferase
LTCLALYLTDPADVVAVEDPCYLGALSAMEFAGASVLSVPVGSQGLELERLESAAVKPKLIYVTPSHQYPTGVTTSLKRRFELLEYAGKNKCWILEDDYDGEFRYDERPLPSIQGLQPDAPVVYLGSLNKALFGGLRAMSRGQLEPVAV